MTPLPDGVRPEDIPGNRPKDELIEDIWADWWREFRDSWNWLIAHFRHRGHGELAADLNSATTPEEIHQAVEKAETMAVELELPAAEGEARTLRSSLPPIDPQDAIEDAEDRHYGV